MDSSSNAAQAHTFPALEAQAPASGSPHAPIDSAALLQGQREVQIHHQGMTYRLQATRMGKLILTK